MVFWSHYFRDEREQSLKIIYSHKENNRFFFIMENNKNGCSLTCRFVYSLVNIFRPRLFFFFGINNERRIQLLPRLFCFEKNFLVMTYM